MEILFILMVIFVAYGIYVVVNKQKATSHALDVQAMPVQPVVAEKSANPRAAPKNKGVPETKKATATAIKPDAKVSVQAPGKKGLKDPKTGEIATNYRNYRFTNRWIKEALVSEKLLEKVYKNDELNADIEAKIKIAVLKLEAIKKYKV